MQDMEKRIARSVELFKSGYNCSQSVVAALPTWPVVKMRKMQRLIRKKVSLMQMLIMLN